MKTRIEFVRVSGGMCWFVDVWVDSFGGCWKNASCFATKAEAEKYAEQIKRG